MEMIDLCDLCEGYMQTELGTCGHDLPKAKLSRFPQLYLSGFRIILLVKSTINLSPYTVWKKD